MYYQQSQYLINNKIYLDSIIKESEDFYNMINYIKIKCSIFLKSFLNLFTHFPQIVDMLSFIVFKLQKV